MRPPVIAATLALAVAAAAAGCGSGKKEGSTGIPTCDQQVSGNNVVMREIGQVTGAALLVTSPPGDPRLFVLEQRGAIRIISAEQLLPAPFLDLSADAAGPVVAGGEQGLLGLAFHPRYAETGVFYIFYTTRQPGNALRDVLARCTVSAESPDRASRTCTEVLSIADFATNHNGGMIEFGADGYLYVGTGDGGGGGDPQRTAQNPDSLLGKILRLDVDRPAASQEYGIPADNPYAGGGGRPEIFITGVRNPWRWTFDRETGDMWIADVGQGAVEELTVLRPAQQKGADLGWSMYEGDACYRPPCTPGAQVFPQDVRLHADGWESITGGQVYRGTCYPDLAGWYFYADYAKGAYARARLRDDDTLEVVDLAGPYPGSPASIHEDSRGELYVTTTHGTIFHIEAAP
ncbi:MAG TPA: PQQ-dependent sugar dehydrogenase [Kofleriaceae bacterium]|nr:PQQ-dependent sugar dehydrogenase [Kofleriaceae bacterium]